MARLHDALLRIARPEHNPSEGAPLPLGASVAHSPGEWPGDLWDRVAHNASLRHMWAPFYEHGYLARVPVDPLFLALVVLAFVALAVAGVWRGRANRASLAAASFGGLFLLYKVCFLPTSYYEWYVVPFMALAALFAAGGLAALSRLAPRGAIAVAAALALAFAVHLPSTFVLERRTQYAIEDRVRRPMAEYLGRVARPGERVVSESAGYVGYYGGVTLYDYPGLTSPGALSALEALPPERREPLLVGMPALTDAVQPEWIVARPAEWDALRATYPRTAARYALDRVFSVPKSSTRLRFAGVAFISFDGHFLVLRRSG